MVPPPWLVWIVKWLAKQYIKSQLTKLVTGAITDAFDAVTNILPYVDLFNEFVLTMHASWTAGTFPNLIYYPQHGNFYRFDFPYPYAVNMTHFPQAFVGNQTSLLSFYYKTQEPFLFYDLVKIIGDAVDTTLIPEIVTKSERIDATNIMGNVYDKKYDNSPTYCNFGYVMPLPDESFRLWDAYPYKDCVRWQEFGGWSYKPVAGNGFEKFTPFKQNGSVYLRGQHLYYYNSTTQRLTIFYAPRQPEILFDNQGTLTKNETEAVLFEGQVRFKGDNSGLDTWQNGAWHHFKFFV
jgi:hypothetical protein